MTAQPLDHDRSRRALEQHFAGTIAPAEEAALRAHLPACEPCRRRYARHLLLARLERGSLGAEERLGRGLGLRRGRRVPLSALLVPALAAAAVALVLLPRVGPSREGGALAARGAAGAPALWVYQVGPAGPPRLAEGAIAAGDELAFAYGNPGGQAHLLVFGVDEHQHVYWFHPAWPEGTPPPGPVAAKTGTGPHELTGAVRHALDGHRLEVYAVFSAAPIAVPTIEREAAAGGLEALGRQPGLAVSRRSFAVTR